VPNYFINLSFGLPLPLFSPQLVLIENPHLNLHQAFQIVVFFSLIIILCIHFLRLELKSNQLTVHALGK